MTRSIIPLVFAIVAITTHGLKSGTLNASYPSDSDLIDLLNGHRATFDELATMAAKDTKRSSFMIMDDSPVAGLADARRDLYRKLLLSVHPGLMLRADASLISFSYWSGGDFLAIGRSWLKGLAYFPNGVRADVKLIKGLDDRPKNDGAYAVPVDGKWYLLYLQTE